MTGALEWINRNLPAAPSQLSQVMADAVNGTDPQATQETLPECALHLYEAVIESSGGREIALSLLAADALFTHAFEVQASVDPEAMTEFARRWGAAGRLGALSARLADSD